MGDISLDMIQEFFSLKPLTKTNTLTPAKISGRWNVPTQTNAFQQEFKLPKKTNPQSPPPSPAYVGGYCSTGPKLEDLYDEMDEFETNPPPGAADEIPAALREEEDAHIFENYSFDHTYSPDLPITSYRQQIVDTIESNSVTIIQGATGSGKTTQVPQYILDEYAKDQRYCNIIVTQPRRIAAISISKRVCQERGWTQGSLVGYQVGRDSCVSEDTRLSYVTTGTLLQKLIHSKNMNQYTHVILDEVHERDRDTDFCMLVVKKLLRTNSKHVKVVLMSATIESDLFSMYFAVPVRGRVEGAPVITVEGKSFPVVECYLDDLYELTGMIPEVKADEPCITKEGYQLVAELIQHLDEVEAESAKSLRQPVERGTVLVFLPGEFEIKQMDTLLDEMLLECQLLLLPLHSKITTHEQGNVFKKPEEGFRKVILATNIAESSITVPDIKYVIDFCLVKCQVCDEETNFQSLRLQWSSKASSTQRKGRAGRVSPGTCYRIVPRDFYEEFIPEFGIPEMQRCPLEQIVLKVKLFDIGPPKAVLRLALQPPDPDDIERTVLLLKQVGALTIYMKNGVINPWDGELTFIGKVLGELPVDVHLGKLLVLGYVFGCLEECLVISASLSLQSFFSKPFRKEFKFYMKKMGWSDYSHSDCITVLNAYKEWNMLKRRKGFLRGEQNWCKENFIIIGRIREVEQLVTELTNRLKGFNIISTKPLHQKNITSPENMRILKLMICGAFYPNFFVSSDMDESEVMKTMSGHDPFSTVMVRNVPPHGALYKSAIARLFRECGRGKAIYFEDTRAYIEFERPQHMEQVLQTNTILPAVYLALKMRKLGRELSLYVSEAKTKQMDEIMDKRHAAQIGRLGVQTNLRSNKVATSLSSRGAHNVYSLPPQQVDLPLNGYLEILTTAVVDAGHFWAQKPDRESFTRLHMLQDGINRNEGRNLRPFQDMKDIRVGIYCIALYEDELYYRAKLVSFKDNFHVEVLYVDYGNLAVVNVRNLRQMEKEFSALSFQAFECMLCEVAPVPSARCPTGTWSQDATKKFIELAGDRRLVAKVYSRVRNVLRVDLYDTSTEEDIHINQTLIDYGFAVFQEESHASKMAHRNATSGSGSQGCDNTTWLNDLELEVGHIRDDRECRKVNLRGPESPIEMSFYSITNIGRLRSVRIEQNSVNSVVLNDQPQDPHQRFLVAANLSINATGTTVVARDTTLMPNIHGLMSIVALIFAPYTEMRADPEYCKYTGALVGLGFDPHTGKALLPDHDSELVFEVDIDQDDLIKINSLRTTINLMFESEAEMAEWGTSQVEKLQKRSRNMITTLILKTRQSVKPWAFPRSSRWNQIDPAYKMNPIQQPAGAVDCALYTLHCGIAISDRPLEDDDESRMKREEKREQMQWLRSLEGRSSEMFSQEVVCPLCNVQCRHPRGVAMHLRSALHRELEEELYLD
ncbi:unnamed protein product [Porites lobata]|uniref:RNA helicase n=1 Tax=Porites lobata TaxID=104759 RepID=A0ABN8QP31_9CNID|nr:unnamed protein product [Porites lobata]